MERFKSLLFFCFLTVLLCGAGTGDIWAGTWTSGATTVTVSGSTVTVSGNGPMADYTSIGDRPWALASITDIIIEEGVTRIGAYAFIENQDTDHPSNVARVTIPVSVTSIGESAFASNRKVATVRYSGSPNEWASIAFANDASTPFGDTFVSASSRKMYFHGCDFSTTTLTLAPGLTTVNDYAFYKMRLVNVNIPGSVSHIGRWAFRSGISGQVCINRATPPTTGTQAFTYTTDAVLYVPSGSKSAYMSTPWYRSTVGAFDGAKEVQEQAVSGTLSASYGSGVTWALDEDGVLTLDASAPSASKSVTLEAGGSYPWGYFRRLVDKVRLRGEISALGNALAYHWFLRGVILDQNTIPTCSSYIGTSNLTTASPYNSLFNPCHPLTMQVKLSSLITPSEADKLESAPWNDGHWETVIDEEVVIDENSADNMALLAAVRTYIDRPFTMRLQRSVSNAYYNTFCPPADLSAEQVESVFGAGSEIHALTGSSYDASANELTLNFADAQDYMEAGVPYLFRPANNVSNPVFTDVAPSSTAASEGSVNAPHVVFRGTLEPRDVTTAEISAKNFIFLQAENHLNWANSGTLKGMRAYWLLKEGVPAHALARRPVMRIGNAATGTESILPSEVRSQKILHNGQLYLMYEGRMYDVQGRRIQ